MTINEKERTSKLLAAISNPIRFEITFLIGMQGSLNVGQVADHFNISRPAISNHLRILREAEIVDAEKSGQEVYYSLNNQYLENELTAILEMIRHCPHKKT